MCLLDLLHNLVYLKFCVPTFDTNIIENANQRNIHHFTILFWCIIKYEVDASDDSLMDERLFITKQNRIKELNEDKWLVASYKEAFCIIHDSWVFLIFYI